MSVSGGSGTPLAKNSVLNEYLAGTGADRIYYYVCLDDNGTRTSLIGILANGSGRIELAGHIFGIKKFLGECQDRVLFECNKNLYSVTKTNMNLVPFPTGGLLYSDHIYPFKQPMAFFDRVMYACGTSSSWTTRLCTPANTDNMDLAIKIKHDATLDWTSRKIIVQLGMAGTANNTICIYTRDGFGEGTIGDAFAANPQKYILSTATRHLYAHQPQPNVDNWHVRSVLHDGNDDVLLATGIPDSFLHYFMAF